MHTPFLKLVAEAYAKRHDDVSEICFVFPNKRSATFFSKYLDTAMNREHLAPGLMTISEFVTEFSDGIDASRYEQLFVLYNEYAKLSKEIGNFDRFMFWCDMLISDFNDVDRYMVDADQLFVNVERLKEINSNYLTEEQLNVIRRYWGDEKPHEYREQFWSHVSNSNDDEQAKANKKFLKLWEVLCPLYHEYRKELRKRGLTTSGMRYREAATRLRTATANDFEFKRYVFCGFNVLSTAEIQIFSRMKALGIADYYWDYNSPTFKLPRNRAGRFIEKNIKDFPSIYPLDQEDITSFPEIKIVGVPSNVGQAKLAGKFVSDMIETGVITNRENAINTAIVLPDETLFIPLIHSIPLGEDKIQTLNITMGFPMRLSPVASLVHNIIMLQLKVRNVHSMPAFFHEDVRVLLGMPTIYGIAPKECEAVLNVITSKRMFMLPAQMLCEIAPSYELIFSPIGPKSGIKQVKNYLDSVLDFVDASINKSDQADRELQHQFIIAYKQAVMELYEAASEYKIEMQDLTFFQLMERTIHSAKINFRGEPLKGLQVMGMLETRSLDFENVVVLSMNERIFPRKQFSKSFIPESLRKAYGMATNDFQESIYAYYFYRLIARAKNVWLTYDARNVGGTKSSEMSRYLTQLLYLFKGSNATHSIATFRGTTFTSPEIIMSKTGHVMKMLNKFLTPGSGFNLSPSAIHTYIECPLHFYLQYVEGYRSENEITEYMDSATYGTILHAVSQKFYESVKESGHPVITSELLQQSIKPGNRHFLERIITETVNKEFNKLDDDKLLTPLVGEALVMGKVMLETVVSMFRREIPLTPFTFIEAEKKVSGQYKVNRDLSVNVYMIIDRIDEINGTRRFIDYKTGSDELSVPSVEKLFDPEYTKNVKGIMQLLFYCLVYRYINNDDRPVQPLIYKLSKISIEGINPLKIGGNELTDYHEVLAEYEERLHGVITEIFSKDIPFTQAKTENACTFCEFKSICQREGSKF